MKTILRLTLAVLTAGLLSACEKGPVTPPGQPNTMQRSAKRGICYNSFSTSDLSLMCPAISWAYNWGKTTSETQAQAFDAAGIDYCPMVWSGHPDLNAMKRFVEAHPNTQYLLAFNEPNLRDQANMTPYQAAQLWPEVVDAARQLNLKLVSPAMNYGTLAGYSDPCKWLDEFFSQPGVSIDDIDAISIHCYMSSVGGLRNFVEKFRRYNKPVWLTEFCAWDPAPSNAEKQCDYMCQALNYLEQEPLVQRYSWFMLKTAASLTKVPFNQLVTHDDPSQLTPQGQIYTLFSTFDRTTWLNTVRAIHAGEFCFNSNDNLTLSPTTDYEVYGIAGRNGLMINSFTINTILEYQIQNDNATSQLIMHHCGYANASLRVSVDGHDQGSYQLPRNGSTTEWATTSLPIHIRSGHHTIRLSVEDGSCTFSGFELR